MSLTVQKNHSSFGYKGAFQAMASPCEVLIDTECQSMAEDVSELVYQEAIRIEKKYSRYRKDNIIHQLHQHRCIEVDEETAKMLDFAASCYQLSNGLFDITSGILRKIWRFDGNSNAPSRKQVKQLLPYIGWHKVSWDGQRITVPEGMEVDFGGFGKEYAVDQAMELVMAKASYQSIPLMINFGGDLRANQPPKQRSHWTVGIANRQPTSSSRSSLFQLQHGAIATSGDAYRYLYHKGKKLSHILNPRTGWSVSQAPSSITVGMPTCLEAGFVSTLAMLHGKDADLFLKAQEVKYSIQL